MQYQVIAEIKKTEKGRVSIVSAEGYPFPAVLKEVRRGERTVFDMLAGVKSEHIPQIYCVEETEDGLLVLEEYVEGELLSTYLREKKLTEAECLRIAEELCEALETLHGHTPVIIHRDIKPSNVVIGKNGVVKLIDFDSSRLYKEEVEEDTRILGTERFAPPEQYGFSQTDCRSDIYSLGVVFGMFSEFMSEGKEKGWRRMVEKCTAFAPESRFQTVAEVKKSIAGAKQGLAGKRISWVAGGLVLVCIAAAVLFVPNAGRGAEPTPPPTKEPTPEATITVTPEATATPAPTESPVNEAEIAPEWRDNPEDPMVYVELKQEIRERRNVVLYCFKDRLGEKDFLLQIKGLEHEAVQFLGVRLYSYLDGKTYAPEEAQVFLRDNVIHILPEYMNGLREGYYQLTCCLRRTDPGQDMECSVKLYVAEQDALKEPESCFQNTTFDYQGGEYEKIHAVLKNDTCNTITGLLDEERNHMDETLYRITENGRVLEVSSDFLRQKRTWMRFYLYAVMQDGTIKELQITNRASEAK